MRAVQAVDVAMFSSGYFKVTGNLDLAKKNDSFSFLSILNRNCREIY